MNWLADAAATAAERGLGALYSVLYVLDGSGRLAVVMPSSSPQRGALARLGQLVGTDLPTSKSDPADEPNVAAALQDGGAVQVADLRMLLPATQEASVDQPVERDLAYLTGLAAPLHWNGASAGLLLLLTARDSAVQTSSAELLARHVAVALANLRERDAGRKRGEVDAVRWVYDERRFLDELGQESRRAKRHQRPLSILLVRVLNLHEMRTSYGRFLAERILRQVAGRLDDAMRDTDFLGASGEDGFGAILIEADRAGAEVAEKRLQDGLQLMTLPHTDLPGLEVHLGFATATHPQDGETADDLIAGAQARLRQETVTQPDAASAM